VTNGHRETRQMTVCCQNLPLGALSSRSTLPVPVGALFKKFSLYLNNPCIGYGNETIKFVITMKFLSVQIDNNLT